jgi:hypothetical protein
MDSSFISIGLGQRGRYGISAQLQTSATNRHETHQESAKKGRILSIQRPSLWTQHVAQAAQARTISREDGNLRPRRWRCQNPKYEDRNRKQSGYAKSAPPKCVD